MPNPPTYSPSFNFSGYQETNPTSPLPGPMVDNELANVSDSLNKTITALSSVRRSDGALANGIVTPESLSAGILIGVQTPTAWATATAYVAGNIVVQANKFYLCLVAHTSGVFATDLAALKWSEVTLSITGYSADQVTYDPTVSGLAAVNVKTALDEIDAKADAIDGAVEALGEEVDALQASAVPVGFIGDYAGATEPPGWLFCYGQAVSRTTYAALFTAISTIHGAGDGTTTFNLPDYRGRVGAGQDDMGGVSANRLTGLSGGVNGDNLGAAGGAESHTITIAQMPGHDHNINVANAPSADGGNSSVRRAAANDGVVGAITTTGGGGAHNNVQPTIILNKIIYAGV